MKLSLENKINLGFGLALLILIGIGFFSYWSITQIVETDKRHEQADEVSLTLTAVASHLKDVEIASRGYVITGQATYLAAYNTALSLIEQDINDLHRLSPVDIYSHERLSRIDSPIIRKLSAIAYLVNLRQKEGFEPALNTMRRDEAELTLEDIRQVIDRMQQEEQILLKQRAAAQEASIHQAIIIVGGGSLAAVIVLLIAISVIKFDLTQRKRIEKSLQESEALFRTTFEEASIGIGLTDLQGGMLTSNLALQKMLGYSLAEFQQMNIAEFTHPDDVDQTIMLHQELNRGERQTYQLEKRYLRRDGQVVWGRITASLVRDSQGRPLFNVGMIEDITERKQAEEVLRQTHLVVESSPAVLFQWRLAPDASWLLDFVSQNVVQFGYTAEEILSGAIDYHSLMLPEDIERTDRELQAHFASGVNHFQQEYRLITKAGQVRWLDSRTVVKRDAEGRIEHTQDLILDMTERKQTEVALRESEEKYRRVIDNVKEIIFQVDTAGQFVFLNLAWAEITGFSIAESLGTSYHNYIHPDDQQLGLEAFQALLAEEIEYCRQAFRFMSKDGRLCWLEVNAQPLRAADGSILGISGSFNDITDRKRAELALRASEIRFRTLTNHAPVGIFETDAQSACIFVNQYWSDLVGITPAEAMGQGWVSALHPDDREYRLAEWRAAAQADREFALEYRFQRPTGKVIWVSGKAVALRNEAGEVIGYLGTITDITESKHMSELLSQRATQLLLINEISSAIAAVLDLDSVLDRAANLVQATFGYHHVALFLLDKEVAYLKAIAGSYTQYFPANHTQEFDRGIIGWVATHGQKIVANDVSQEPRYISKIADQTVTRAELCLPIKVADQTVGVLDLQSPRLDTFGENDITLMETLVDQIAVAIENARLYQAAQLELAERKQAEEALRISQAQLSEALDIAKLAYWEIDRETKLVELNDQFYALHRTSAAQEGGYAMPAVQYMQKFVHPDDFPWIVKELQALFEIDDLDYGNQYEYRIVCPDGEEGYLMVRFRNVYDPQRQTIKVAGIILDITERKRMEAVLAAERNLLRTLLDNLPDSIYVKDTQGRHLMVNHATVQGTSAATIEDMLGKTDLELYSSEAAQQWYANDLAIIQSGLPLIDQEEFSLDETGRINWVLTTKLPLYDSHGKVTGLVGVTRNITERKQMEMTLAAERNLMRTLIDNLPDLIFAKDTESRLLLVNEASLRVSGKTMAETLGKTDFEVNPSELAAQYYADDQKVIRSGQPIIDREEPNLSAGQLRWFSTTKVPLRDSQGQVTGLIGMSRDITTRKQMEEALRRSEERFALAVQGSNDGIWDNDMVNNSVYFSPRLLELYGYDPAEFEPTFDWFISSLHPDDEERVFAAIQAHLTERVPYNLELRSRLKSGEYRQFRITGQAVWDETGRPLRMAGSVSDITERKQMEATLAEERNLLHTVINATPDWIFIKDQHYRFRLVNQAYASLFGLAPEDIVGKTDLDLGIPEDIVKGNPEKGIQGFWPDDRKVMDSGETKYIAEEPILIDGQAHILSTVKVPLRDEAAKVWGVLGFVHDITHLKRTEDELRQAKEVAESAARAKSEFLANMSHEIRTPLNAIIGMTSLLLDTPLSSEQHDFTETVRTSGEVLLTIINDILDFSKIEAGKLELEMQPFELHQCIEESLDLVAIKAAEKKLDLAYLIDDSTPGTLVGDVTRLRQILVNLLNNAVKFTEQGEIVLSVRSRLLKHLPAKERVSQNDDVQASLYPYYEVHLAVRDTGIGIPPDRMDRLFRSFSQVDTSTTRKYGGTGLGLTISKRLSEMMGGEMWVESEGLPGEGAIFHFTLLAQAAPSQVRVYLRDKHPELTGKRLLIVDDNATNRLILARQAQSWGMLPRAASSGQEALAWINRNDPFDLVILDMQMPDMDGLMVAAEIRRHRTVQALPIVMLTSLGSREHNDQTAQVELAAFLTKPIKPSQLYNILVGIFQGQPVKIRADATRPALDTKLGQRHPLRILLAEDNTVNQKVALHMLERMGYRADVAANGLEALQALQRQAYDVVLMDMQMPEMDGLEATHAIHEQWPVAERPRIIAMTANALQGDRERCLEAGMDDYISKPVRPEELAGALRRSQSHSGQAETSRVSTRPLQRVGTGRPGSETPPNQKAPALEARALAELRQLLGEQAPQMILELIALYIETAPPLLAEMHNALQNKDASALHHAAHTLKPGSAYLGAVQFAALCAELELMGKTGQLKGAAAKLAELEAEFSRVLVALEIEKRDNSPHEV